MDVMIDMRVAELMASRLCHDIVGPVGAVNNGIELLSDEEFDMSGEALELVGRSAEQAATALQYFRLAYGMAGNRQGSDMTPLRELATRYLAHSKAELDWPASPLPEGAPEGTGKLLLNMIELAVEALPRGGTIGVAVNGGGGPLEAEVKAVGADAGLREEIVAALADSVQVDDLNPRNLQGYVTRQMARRLGGDLLIETVGPGYLRIAASLQPV